MRLRASMIGILTMAGLLLLLFAAFLTSQYTLLHVGIGKLIPSLLSREFLYTVPGIVAVSTLGGYIAYLLFLSQKHASLLAGEMTHDLAIDREQFRRLYDHSPVPYITISQDGIIENPNKAAVRLFKLTYKGLEGKDFFALFHEEDSELATELKARFKRNIPFDQEEIRIVCDDGVVRWVMLSVFSMQKAASREHAGVVTLVDITERKELDEAKSQFVSLASHQLRTPITTVKWYAGMLLKGDAGELLPKQREYMEKVCSGNETMIELVDTLLNVSRVEMGSVQVDLKDTNAIEVCESVVDENLPKIQGKHLVVEKDYDDTFETIQSDKRLLRIVFQNIISNAVKYTPDEGTVTISLKTSPGEKRIIVTDTGYGIPPEQQDKIFNKMFRADNVRKMSVEGNGLGLYLVKSIVEKLGGTISFVSEENKGTTFTVALKQ